MNNDEKVRIIDLLIEQVKESLRDQDVPFLVGLLNHPYGLNGFKMDEIGHPVFELNDRYIVYLESESPIQISKYGQETIYQHFKISVPFYKTTLSPYITFLTTPALDKPVNI